MSTERQSGYSLVVLGVSIYDYCLQATEEASHWHYMVIKRVVTATDEAKVWARLSADLT